MEQRVEPQPEPVDTQLIEPVPLVRTRTLRRVLGAILGVGMLGALLVFYAVKIEPTWIQERTVVLGSPARVRCIHITDIHYRGDRRYLERVVEQVNALPGDFVCLTGDIVEDLPFLDEALDILAGVSKPMYGVRGNHDCWDAAAVAALRDCCRSTGGDWLLDESVLVLDGRVEVIGSTGRLSRLPAPKSGSPAARVLLVHDPIAAARITNAQFDVILAGHTHGGQVRIPGKGALLDLVLVGELDLGLFRTQAGPLYVNPGIGTFAVPARFGCRPEITIIEL